MVTPVVRWKEENEILYLRSQFSDQVQASVTNNQEVSCETNLILLNSA